MNLAIIIALSILGIELVIGIIANGLIIIANCTEWIRSRKLTSCDKILTSLGIYRFFLQCMIFANNIFFASSPVMDGQCDIWRILYIVWLYLSTLSLWFATWLSVFYCVKIANFSQPLFLWLKRRISGLLPKLLMGSLLVSLVTCVSSVNAIDRKYVGNSTNNMSMNTRVKCRPKSNSSSGLIILSMLGYSFPFFIFIIPSLLLIISLWRHTKRMEKNTSSSQHTIADAHVSAIKGLVSLIFFYVSYFMALILFLLDTLAHSSVYFIWFWVVVMTAYPCGHSVVLILSNPKLKTAAARALNYAKCRLKDGAS